jgi:hypothetical protein
MNRVWNTGGMILTGENRRTGDNKTEELGITKQKNWG